MKFCGGLRMVQEGSG